jgi:hypothetical protein
MLDGSLQRHAHLPGGQLFHAHEDSLGRLDRFVMLYFAQ